MAFVDNYDWLVDIPEGWVLLARNMLDEIKVVNPSFEVTDMKEKWGMLRVYGWYEDEETEAIIRKYEKLSSFTCCHCGMPATKLSTGWILPWCDRCGIDDEKYYKRL